MLSHKPITHLQLLATHQPSGCWDNHPIFLANFWELTWHQCIWTHRLRMSSPSALLQKWPLFRPRWIRSYVVPCSESTRAPTPFFIQGNQFLLERCSSPGPHQDPMEVSGLPLWSCEKMVLMENQLSTGWATSHSCCTARHTMSGLRSEEVLQRFWAIWKSPRMWSRGFDQEGSLVLLTWPSRIGTTLMMLALATRSWMSSTLRLNSRLLAAEDWWIFNLKFLHNLLSLLAHMHICTISGTYRRSRPSWSHPWWSSHRPPWIYELGSNWTFGTLLQHHQPMLVHLDLWTQQLLDLDFWSRALLSLPFLALRCLRHHPRRPLLSFVTSEMIEASGELIPKHEVVPPTASLTTSSSPAAPPALDSIAASF